MYTSTKKDIFIGSALFEKEIKFEDLLSKNNISQCINNGS